MISLDRNLSKTWTVVNAPSSQSKNNEERVEFHNFQLQKLVDKIPTGHFKSLEATVTPPPWLQAGLKKFCRLRVHHVKILTQISASGSIRDLISNLNLNQYLRYRSRKISRSALRNGQRWRNQSPRVTPNDEIASGLYINHDVYRLVLSRRVWTTV